MQQRWGLPLIAWPSRLRPNFWDLMALPMVLGAIALIAWGGMAMSAHYQVGQVLTISLDPSRLPEYALRRGRRQEPPGGEDLDPGARHSPIGSDPGLFVDHGHRVHRVVPRPPARCRMRCDLRDLHVTSLEHDVQRLSVAAYCAGRVNRSRAHVPPVAL